MKIIYNYIFKELLFPFLFGVAAFTGIFIGTDLLFDLTDIYIEYEVGLLTVLRLFLLAIPPIIVLTFPMATLLATIMCYNRMSGDSEIIALRAGGISVYKILVPALVGGLLMSLLTIGINEFVVPQANYIYNRIEWEARHGEVMPRTQRDLFWTPLDSASGRPDFILYAGYFDGETGIMTDVFLQDYYQGRPATLVEASKAEWKDGGWLFYEGIIYHLKPGSRVPSVSFEFWEAEQITDRPSRIGRLSRDIDDMNLAELSDFIQIKREQGQQVYEELVEWHTRLSIPFANFIFVLLAAPLGIKPRRSGGSALAMGLSIVVIFFYYILMSVGDALATRGTIEPWLGAWLSNIILVIIGGYMLFRSGK